ncbi:type IV toxin-antitoxin system YeeU family antitoxin, partial [Escherichia coli]|nr:type IV toxin-antitoxin system YeeU family antitoxin [Escherichia coli]
KNGSVKVTRTDLHRCYSPISFTVIRSGELNPRHQHTVTLYAKGLTCEADTLGSCGYVYLAVYPTPETKT